MSDTFDAEVIDQAIGLLRSAVPGSDDWFTNPLVRIERHGWFAYGNMVDGEFVTRMAIHPDQVLELMGGNEARFKEVLTEASSHDTVWGIP